MMPDSRDFLGKLQVNLDMITGRLLEAGAPPSMHKQQYTAMLVMSKATGDIKDFHVHTHVDEDTGLLAATLCLAMPARSPGIIL